jgi:uncharacterized protein
VIHIGRIQDLIVQRHTSEGMILGDDPSSEVLLPTSECPADVADKSAVRVFVYRDRGGHLLATTKPPKVQAGEFAQLRVNVVTDDGAYMSWGLPVDLFVPYREQKKPLDEGRWYLVRVALNKETDQLYGSTRIDNFLNNAELTVKQGDEVPLVVFGKSELGLSVIVNNAHQGLVHSSDIFKPVSVGDRITGYVRQVREDNKLDIALQPIGYRQFNDVNTTLLAKRLQGSQGFLPLNDKSTAEAIHAEFGISKKAFKKALGALYKERKVRIEDQGIVWIG